LLLNSEQTKSFHTFNLAATGFYGVGKTTVLELVFIYYTNIFWDILTINERQQIKQTTDFKKQQVLKTTDFKRNQWCLDLIHGSY
jgi:hypothetical protein